MLARLFWLVVSLFLLCGNACADTAFTSFSFSATGASGSRTDPDRWSDWINVLDYGADPTGATDSAAAINAAIVKAAAKSTTTGGTAQGGTVFFPPGDYKVTVSLVNNTAGTYVNLVGSGKYTTGIFGTVTGFIINSNDAAAGGTTTTGWISRVANMQVINNAMSSGVDITNGAIQLNHAQGAVIENVVYGGWTGISMWSNAFNSRIVNADSTGPGSIGTIGIYFNSVGIYNSTALGYDVGMQGFGTGSVMIGTRTESDNTGVLLGQDYTGTAMTLSGFKLSGHSTERCATGVYAYQVAGVSIEDLSIGGTIGPTRTMSAISGSAGTVTVTVSGTTMAQLGWTSGTNPIQITGVTPSGFNTSGFVTGTRIDATHFTYSNATTGSGTGGNWSMEIQYGLRVRGAQQALFNGVSVGVTNIQQAGIDLYADGSTSGGGNTIISSAAGTDGWIVPPAISKANYQYISSDNPAGATNDAAGRQSGMNFADLPGQSGVQTSAVEGMEFNIVDGKSTNCGDSACTAFGTNVTGGTGALHLRVRWNAATSHWTLMGI